MWSWRFCPTPGKSATTGLVNQLGIIGREVWHILQARRRGKAAARLHVQIVALFSIIAALPSILVAVVASVTLDRGLDRLFSIRARSMIENSLIVADAYIREHAQSIRADTDAMAIDIARAEKDAAELRWLELAEQVEALG